MKNMMLVYAPCDVAFNFENGFRFFFFWPTIACFSLATKNIEYIRIYIIRECFFFLLVGEFFYSIFRVMLYQVFDVVSLRY